MGDVIGDFFSNDNRDFLGIPSLNEPYSYNRHHSLYPVWEDEDEHKYESYSFNSGKGLDKYLFLGLEYDD